MVLVFKVDIDNLKKFLKCNTILKNTLVDYI